MTPHRLQRAYEWKAWGWQPYQSDSVPIVGQAVDVRLPNNQLRIAVYDPKWENGFCTVDKTEALPVKPLMWRNRVGGMGHRAYRPDAEHIV